MDTSATINQSPKSGSEKQSELIGETLTNVTAKPSTRTIVQVLSARVETSSERDPILQSIKETIALFNRALRPLVETLDAISKNRYDGLIYNLDNLSEIDREQLSAYVRTILRADAQQGPHLFSKLAPRRKLTSDGTARKVVAAILEDETKLLTAKLGDDQKERAAAISTIVSETSALLKSDHFSAVTLGEASAKLSDPLCQVSSGGERQSHVGAMLDIMTAAAVLLRVREGWKPFEPLRASLGLRGIYDAEVISQAVAHISSHRSLAALWEAEHRSWELRCHAWLNDAEHPERAKYAPHIESLRALDASKEHPWWRRFLNHFRAHPELAAWRGGEAVVRSLREEEITALRSAHADNFKQFIPGIKRAFFERNQELGALWDLHLEFRENFLRPVFKAQHADGFKSPPTFTLPDGGAHRRLPLLPGAQSGGGYSALNWNPLLTNIERSEKPVIAYGKKRYAGSATLVLLKEDPQTGVIGAQKLKVPLTFDERFAHFSAIDQSKGRYLWSDPHGRFKDPVTLSSARLLLRAEDRTPYLTFTVNREVPRPQKIELAKETGTLISPSEGRIAAIVPAPGELRIAIAQRNGTELLELEEQRVRCDTRYRVPDAPDKPTTPLWRAPRSDEVDFKVNAFRHIARIKDEIREARRESFGGAAVADPSHSSAQRAYLDNFQTSLARKAASEALQRIMGRYEQFDPANRPVAIIYPEYTASVPKDGGRFHDKIAFERFHTEVGNELARMCARYGIHFLRRFSPAIYRVSSDNGKLIVPFAVKRDEEGKASVDLSLVHGKAVEPESGKVYGSVEQNAARNLLRDLIDPRHLDPWREYVESGSIQRKERFEKLCEAARQLIRTE